MKYNKFDNIISASYFSQALSFETYPIAERNALEANLGNENV